MTPEQVRIVIPEPVFTLFDAMRDGLPEVIVVNESLLAFPHLDVFPWYLRITLDAKELIENGMPAPEESALLFDIGDEIEAVVLGGRSEHNGQNALFLARSTWNAVRELRFQVHDPEIAHQALQALLSSREWSRTWDYEMSADPEWSKAGYVFQLFPQARGRDA